MSNSDANIRRLYKKDIKDYDFVIMGAPWEEVVTWGSEAPETIRIKLKLQKKKGLPL